jgi:hypothetical protein
MNSHRHENIKTCKPISLKDKVAQNYTYIKKLILSSKRKHDISITNLKRLINFREIIVGYVVFNVFTAVTVNNTVFWVVTKCSSGNFRRFGGTYCRQLQGSRVSQARNKPNQAGFLRITRHYNSEHGSIYRSSFLEIIETDNYFYRAKCSVFLVLKPVSHIISCHCPY